MSHYPIDFDQLERGQILTKEELRTIFPGVRDESLRLKAMGLGSQIKRYFWEHRGAIVAVCYPKDGIHILTPQEQDAYAESDKQYALRRFARRHREDAGNDDSQLTEAQRVARRERLIRDSWRLQQLRKRNLPLPNPKELPEAGSD